MYVVAVDASGNRGLAVAAATLRTADLTPPVLTVAAVAVAALGLRETDSDGPDSPEKQVAERPPSS